MVQFRRSIVVAAVGAGFVVATAEAATVYTDRTAWENAVGAWTTEDFEASPLGELTLNGTTDLGLVSVFTGGIATNGSNVVVDGGLVNGSRELQGFIQEGTVDTFNISFDTGPQIAWGADFVSATTGDLLTVTVDGVTYRFQDYLGIGGGNGFLGIVADNAFTQIDFGVEALTTFGEFWAMDDLSFATPAPGALALLAVFGVAGSRRRR